MSVCHLGPPRRSGAPSGAVRCCPPRRPPRNQHGSHPPSRSARPQMLRLLRSIALESGNRAESPPRAQGAAPPCPVKYRISDGASASQFFRGKPSLYDACQQAPPGTSLFLVAPCGIELVRHTHVEARLKREPRADFPSCLPAHLNPGPRGMAKSGPWVAKYQPCCT